MLSTLFHIPPEFLGFGWGLGLWAAVAAVALGWSYRRHGLGSETLGLSGYLLAGAAVIVWLLPAMADERGLPIRGYGVMLLVSILAGAALAGRRFRQMGADPEALYNLAFWLVLSGVIGARLFYIVQYREQFRGTTATGMLLEMLNVTEGGLVVYGGLIAGAAAFVVLVRMNRWPALALCDLIAPSVALGMGLGRIGCFLNGCCYGGPTDLPWALRFPAGSPPQIRQYEEGEVSFHGLRFAFELNAPPRIVEVESGSPAEAAGVRPGMELATIQGQKVTDVREALDRLIHVPRGIKQLEITTDDGRRFRWVPRAVDGRSLPIHPTQLYSAVDGLLLAALLWCYYPFRRHDGELLAGLLVLHPLSRFLLEVIRQDEGSFLGTGLTISQVVSVVLAVGGVALWAWLLSLPAGSVLPAQARIAAP